MEARQTSRPSFQLAIESLTVATGRDNSIKNRQLVESGQHASHWGPETTLRGAASAGSGDVDEIHVDVSHDIGLEEQETLFDFLFALRKSHIRDFLVRVGLPTSGTKEALRSRLIEAVRDGSLVIGEIVSYLDSVACWGKQHLFLYDGPQGDIEEWRDPAYVKRLLAEHQLDRLFNSQLPLVLPEVLTLSSVTHNDGKLRVTAVQKREYVERASEHDEERVCDDRERITLRAYVHHVARTLVVFEWDLNANTATLQITQLQEDGDYENLSKEFSRLVQPWLDLKQFVLVDLRPAIRRLHEIENTPEAEVRSHGIDYRSPQGRRVSARSPSPRASVLGEDHIDEALENVRKNSVGHLGNFYWLPNITVGHVPNPLTNDVHVIIVGAKSRINFPTPNPEEALRYVLHRMRSVS